MGFSFFSFLQSKTLWYHQNDNVLVSFRFYICFFIFYYRRYYVLVSFRFYEVKDVFGKIHREVLVSFRFYKVSFSSVQSVEMF
ncbi:hypothetical protein YN1HA_18810 [Sulfurisphaera ohwakuensis]